MNHLFAALRMFVAIALALVLTARIAQADGATGVAVQPLTPKPGDVITVKGEVLGADREVEVRLIGAGVDIDLGEVQTDAEGDFTAQFRIPADLTPGSYQIQANGAATVTTAITVVSAPSDTATTPMEPAMMAAPTRERSLAETIGLVALFGILSGLGLFFARTARREPAAG